MSRIGSRAPWLVLAVFGVVVGYLASTGGPAVPTRKGAPTPPASPPVSRAAATASREAIREADPGPGRARPPAPAPGIRVVLRLEPGEVVRAAGVLGEAGYLVAGRSGEDGRLWTWGEGPTPPREVAPVAGEARPRQREGALHFLGPGSVWVTWRPPAEPVREALALPAGRVAEELGFVYEGGDLAILRTEGTGSPGSWLYRKRRGLVGPLPVPAGCAAGRLIGLYPRGRALFACPGHGTMVEFGSGLPMSSPRPDVPGEAAVLAAEPSLLVGDDAYLSPDPVLRAGDRYLQIDGSPAPGPEIQGTILGAWKVAGTLVVAAEVRRPDASHTLEILRPGAPRPGAVFLDQELRPPLVAWGDRSLLWAEGAELAVFDLGQGRVVARLAFEEPVSLLPGIYRGERVPILFEGGLELGWLSRSPGAAGVRVEAGVPLPAGRARWGLAGPGQAGCWIGHEEAEGVVALIQLAPVAPG